MKKKPVRKQKKPVLWVLVAGLICMVLFVVYISLAIQTPPFQPDNQVVCTMEAKLCPDGSYVSRVAPSCEFSPCP